MSEHICQIQSCKLCHVCFNYMSLQNCGTSIYICESGLHYNIKQLRYFSKYHNFWVDIYQIIDSAITISIYDHKSHVWLNNSETIFPFELKYSEFDSKDKINKLRQKIKMYSILK